MILIMTAVVILAEAGLCFLICVIGRLWDWLFMGKRQRSILKYVPRYCQRCDFLGLCRDEEKNWKCHHGCLILYNREKAAEWRSILENVPPERPRDKREK